MSKNIQRSEERGGGNYGWLNTKYSFSFSNYFNPNKMGFGVLRVLNDDKIAGGGGIGTHPHENMEIVTIPFKGALAHKDSTGTDGIINSGDIQIMSAGSGIFHSEYNVSNTEPVELLQIWILADKQNIKPRYAQRTFDTSLRQDIFQTVVSPNGDDKADDFKSPLWINQNSYFALAKINNAKTIEYKINTLGNGIFLFVIEGSIKIDGEILNQRDSMEISEGGNIAVEGLEDSFVLVIEVGWVKIS